MEIEALTFRQNLKILSMFLIVQFLGLWLAAQIYSGAQVQQVSGIQAAQSVNYVLVYVLGILVFTAVIILVLGRTKSKIPFVLLEAFAVGGASFIVFLIVIGVITNDLGASFYSNLPTYQDGGALLAAAVLVLAKNRWPRLRNTASIIASAGLGLVIGLNLNFIAVYLFMVILAVYDFIAVFVTKHMVKMGRAMYGMNLAFLIGTTEAQAVPKRALNKEELAKIPEHRMAFEKQKDMLKDLDRMHLVPMVANRGLGNGDLAVPLMVAVSAYRIYWSFVPSLVVVVGATVGLAATFIILGRYKRDLPAIPPLFVGISLALAVYFFAIGAVHF